MSQSNKSSFIIHLVQEDNGLVYALSDIIGEGEDVIKLGLEIMSTLKSASMNGANIYVHPSLYKSKLN